MSKRCCAESCYNAIATNRSVEYFGFPKSEEFAAAWARAAGREDLLEKPLSNIIKYFLCSEHFSDDCFLDPPHNRKLKKTSRPVVVPIPTIFHDNFKECVSKSLKEERNPTINAIVGVPNMVDSLQEEIPDSENGIIYERIEEHNETDLPIESVESVEPLTLTAKDDNVIIKNEHQITDDMEEATDIEMLRYDDLQDQPEEDILTIIDTAVPPDEQIQPQSHQQEGILETTTYTEIIVGPTSCRLCLSTKENELLIPIFEYGSEVSCILESLLPGVIKPDDGLPQQICLACLESATRCLNTIEKFKAIQDKLKELQ